MCHECDDPDADLDVISGSASATSELGGPSSAYSDIRLSEHRRKHIKNSENNRLSSDVRPCVAPQVPRVLPERVKE